MESRNTSEEDLVVIVVHVEHDITSHVKDVRHITQSALQNHTITKCRDVKMSHN